MEKVSNQWYENCDWYKSYLEKYTEIVPGTILEDGMIFVGWPVEPKGLWITVKDGVTGESRTYSRASEDDIQGKTMKIANNA